MDYLDFNVEVGPEAAGMHSVKVHSTEGGEASGSMRALDAAKLKDQLQALQRAILASGGAAAIDARDELAVRGLGRDLWDSLFGGAILSRFDATRQRAQDGNAPGVRVKLSISSPDLAALPWEFLYDEGHGDYLLLQGGNSLIRYLPLMQALNPLAVRGPLNILGLVVSPDDRPLLGVEEEKDRLEEAVAPLKEAGRVNLEWLEQQTWRSLQARLGSGSFHIIHFIGHGGFDSGRGQGQIAFADEQGHSQMLSATAFGRLLGGHRTMKLAVLNSCEGARTDETDVFSSSAATLLRLGIPAVVAMQHLIAKPVALEFSRVFYEVIANGEPVDDAVGKARVAIANAFPDTVAFGTPVLFMHAASGRIFRQVRARDDEGGSGEPEAEADREGWPAGQLLEPSPWGACRALPGPRQPQRNGVPIGIRKSILVILKSSLPGAVDRPVR